MSHCPGCGAALLPDVVYCTMCGKPLALPIAPPPAKPASNPLNAVIRKVGTGRLVLGAVLLVLIFRLATLTSSGTHLTEVVVCKDLDENSAPIIPTAKFASRDKFYCSVHLGYAKRGDVIKARWMYRDGLLEETPYMIQSWGFGYVGFEMSQPDGGWEPGPYRVEIYVGDNKHRTVLFEVEP